MCRRPFNDCNNSVSTPFRCCIRVNSCLSRFAGLLQVATSQEELRIQLQFAIVYLHGCCGMRNPHANPATRNLRDHKQQQAAPRKSQAPRWPALFEALGARGFEPSKSTSTPRDPNTQQPVEPPRSPKTELIKAARNRSATVSGGS